MTAGDQTRSAMELEAIMEGSRLKKQILHQELKEASESSGLPGGISLSKYVKAFGEVLQGVAEVKQSSKVVEARAKLEAKDNDGNV